MTTKTHNALIMGAWIVVIGSGLAWLYVRNQKAKTAQTTATTKPTTPTTT